LADSQPTHDIEAVFRGKGIPFTRQRRLIWGYFAGADRAATIGEAAEALRGDGVGQATVYRTVTLLGDLGLLARVQDGRGEICFIAPPIGHSHPLICGVCRRVVRFDGDGDVADLEARLAATTGFSIYGHHLEVYGICPECRAAREGDRGE
jgi:Fe2+ or Zn2+ uptake regulation protein